MSESLEPDILPYNALVGQQNLKLALEVSYVATKRQGVLLSGERGTGKSTIVRAFARMVHGRIPVTIPINATEDRVVGGWSVEDLMRGEVIEQKGLIEEAHDAGGMLYVDEVNLLDDHVVNILLDVAANGILEVQREGRATRRQVRIALVGTMNPEEGGLRPQLLDRFGLMVNVRTEPDERREVLRQVLRFDKVLASPVKTSKWLEDLRQADRNYKLQLDEAKRQLPDADDILDKCVDITSELRCDGHRGALVLAQAAQACAAIRRHRSIEPSDIRDVAQLALQHRVAGASSANHGSHWGPDEDGVVERILG